MVEGGTIKNNDKKRHMPNKLFLIGDKLLNLPLGALNCCLVHGTMLRQYNWRYKRLLDHCLYHFSFFATILKKCPNSIKPLSHG